MDPLVMLATYLGEQAIGVAGKVMLGSPELACMNKVGERAIDRTLKSRTQELSSEHANHIATLLREFFSGGGMGQFVESPIKGEPVDVNDLLREFVDKEFDPETLGIPARDLLSDLASNFLVEMEEEVRRANSPLFNLITSEQLAHLVSVVTGTSVPLNDLRRAVLQASGPIVRDLKAPHPVAPRVRLQQRVKDFLTSSKRLLIVVGPSGSGKSIALAAEADRVQANGWSVLAIRAFGFSLAEAASAVSAQLPRPPATVDWRRLLVTPWMPAFPYGEHGLVFLVDGIDSPQGDDKRRVLAELIRLCDAATDVPPDHFKIVLSCESSAWSQLRLSLPNAMRATPRRPSDVAIVIDVEDFGDEELDRALEGIEVEEFRRVDRPDGRSDPHVDAMRDLLSHPATFGLYARIRQRGGDVDPEDATTTDLAAILAEQQLEEAAGRCHTAPGILLRYLIELASLVLQQHSSEFKLSLDPLRSSGALAGLEIDSTDAARSPFAAMVERGILTPIEEISFAPFFGFRSRDVGIHFLSLHLELKTKNQSIGDLQQTIDDWLEEEWMFPALFDAVIAWVNRTTRKNNPTTPPSSVAIVRALMERDDVRTEVVARLLSPFAAPAFLRAAEEAGPSAFQYFSAVRAFRSGKVGLQAFRDGIQSQNSLTVRLSATAAGLSRDSEAVPALTGLLDHEEEDIRRAASTALGRIGSPAIPYLLDIIGNVSVPLSRRIRALIALRATGYRTDDVSVTLARCLQDDSLKNHDLVRGLLLAGAKLRVTGLTLHAVAALVSDDWQTALAAAKLLAEVPDESAGEHLQAAIRIWTERTGPNHRRSLVVRQMVVALLKHPSAENQRLALELIRAGLRDEGPLDPDDAAKLPDAASLPQGRGIVLHELLASVGPGPVTRGAVLLHRVTAATWRPDDLDAVTDVVVELQRYGRNMAGSVVDTIIDAIQNQEDSWLAETSFQIEAVQALVRCQAPDLVRHLCRLLPYAGEGLLRHVAYVLWAVGDEEAEGALWASVQSRVSEDSADARSRHELIGTLTTCGTTQSRDGILSYTRSLSRFPSAFHDEILVPLVRRGVLSEDDLDEVVRDQRASFEGRVASLNALVELSSQTWTPLFRDTLMEKDEAALQHAAIRAVALAKDNESIPHLIENLQKVVDTWTKAPQQPGSDEGESFPAAQIAAWSAIALADIEAVHAVPVIEKAVDTFSGRPHELSMMVKALGHLGAPSSLEQLLRLSQNRTSQHLVDATIESLGSYLPNSDAEEVIMAALYSSSGGYDDRGTQLTAIKALARHSPNLLLDELQNLYRLGHLESSARQWLALQAPYLARAEGVDSDRFVRLLASLVSDRDFWVREMVYQTFDRVPLNFVDAVKAQLERSLEPWQRAAAVRLLGVLGVEAAKLELLRRDPDGLIRDAADAAINARKRRRDLAGLVERFGSGRSAERAAAYFALEAQADEWTMTQLVERYPEGTGASYWIDSLGTAAQYRRRAEHRKRGKEEDRKLERLDTVTFD